VPTDGSLDPLCGMLAERHKIEVPIFSWPDPALRILRISAQAYNSLDQYRRLAEVVVAELEREAAGGRTPK
jgi:isopenicillin-N epimerase